MATLGSVSLLGFAFANADFLFETDKAGKILFAAGAASDLVNGAIASLTGSPASGLFETADAAKFNALINNLKPGERSGTVNLTLVTGVKANVAKFCLPQNGGHVSCTLARMGAEQNPVARMDPKTGIASRESFLEAAEKAGAQDSLALLDLPELPQLCARLPSDKADALLLRIGEALNQSGASIAGRLSQTGFGALAPAKLGDLHLAQRIAGAFIDGETGSPKIKETRIGLHGTGLSTEQRLLSLRYVIDQFTENRKVETGSGDIAKVFSDLMAKTEKRLADMAKTLEASAFEIAYQPICDLATRDISHYEALARFNNSEGTGETVKFIEALGVANAFDLAVAQKVLALIEQRSDVQIAFNISGATIASPASFGLLAGMLAKRRKLAPRTLIEITDTSAITDLESAGKAISAIRAMGYRVGLDDFGAGAASVSYLHAFPVDFVKFDGAMIKKMGASEREDALLAGLAKLCSDLKVITIAEWIENREMADSARKLGFHDGQGKWLGAPLLEIPSAFAPIAKRRGVKVSWG